MVVQRVFRGDCHGESVLSVVCSVESEVSTDSGDVGMSEDGG